MGRREANATFHASHATDRFTSIAWAMAGTAVFRMVVSSDCMKNATATSQGSSRLILTSGEGDAGMLMFNSSAV